MPDRATVNKVTFNRGSACETKKPAGKGGFERMGRVVGGLLAVVADGFNGAAFEGFHAQRGIFFSFRLLVDKGIATFVVPGKERRRGLATEITVDALLIDVELAGGVLLPFVCFVSHGFRKKTECPPLSSDQALSCQEIVKSANCRKKLSAQKGARLVFAAMLSMLKEHAFRPPLHA